MPDSSIQGGEQFQELTDKMSHLSWKMLSTVPPMVSTAISDAPFFKEWHDKEIEPDWNESLLEPDYNLVYYRPILFFSYEGKVTQKGWVGNCALEDGERDKNEYIAAAVCSGKEDNTKDVCAQATKTMGGEKREPTRRIYKSYKKPTLKSVGVDSSIPSSSCLIPDIGSESSNDRDLELDLELDEFQLIPFGNEEPEKKEADSTSLYGLRKFHIY